MLDNLSLLPQNPLLELIGLYAADRRADKIDLGIGVYRDEQGVTPIFKAVKTAERALIRHQSSKSYLGPAGNRDYLDLLFPLVFDNVWDRDRIVGIQTLGGTGALRIAADLLAVLPGRRIWVGTPTWSNHVAIFEEAGLQVCIYRQFDVATQAFLANATLDALQLSEPGDVVLLQGCCHNPTGVDPDDMDWGQLLDMFAERSLIPLIDMAYHGLGMGLDADARRLREVIQRVPYAFVAYSCSKNFGLYRDRIGALLVAAPNISRGRALQSHLERLALVSYSMPADHGAAIVAKILASTELRRLWRDELNIMCERIHRIRSMLIDEAQVGTIDFRALHGQHGMFALLPLDAAAIRVLRSDHAIYIADDGRINLAGLTQATVKPFVQALRTVAGVTSS